MSPLNEPEKKLQKAFVSALGMPEQTDFSKLEYSRNDYWDSVAHMRLVAEIEKVFGVMLDYEDVLGLSSYNKAVEILKKLGVSFA
jgi:acyl carrier protein